MALAAEGHPLVVGAVATAKAQEAVGQDAALEIGIELVLGEVRQADAGGLLGLGEGNTRKPSLHEAVRRGLLGTLALVVDRAPTWRPAGLPTKGLHALLTTRPWSTTVSDGAARHRPA